MQLNDLDCAGFIPDKLYPCDDELRRCGIAQAMGLPMMPKVTEKCFIRFLCCDCGHKFKVLGRVAMYGKFGCPMCRARAEK